MYACSKTCLFDFLFSLLAVLIVLPFMLPVILILKFTGEGYIWYLQKRIGYKNKYFNIIKFATMLKNSPNIGTGLITLRNDPRLLPLGRFLRITKLNELPQILNVLKGDMSIVGPRPLVDKTFNAYPENIRFQVYDSKPGITGIGSIIFRDEEHLLSSSDIAAATAYFMILLLRPTKASWKFGIINIKALLPMSKSFLLPFGLFCFLKAELCIRRFLICRNRRIPVFNSIQLQ